MDLLQQFIVGLFLFGNHVIGIMTKPYQTYRHISEKGVNTELVYLFLVCIVYFTIASVVRVAEFRPYLLTREFILLCFGCGFGYVGSTTVLYFLGTIVGGKGSFSSVLRGWGYSLLPTVLWFLSTSLLYILLPPPRTDAWTGIGFSFFYVLFCSVLFFWKAELYYLTLRFSLKLTLPQISLVTVGFIAWGVIFALSTYALGIFRVPFL